MSRVVDALRRLIAWIRRAIAWIFRQLQWLWDQIARLVAGLLRPPYKWLKGVLRALKQNLQKLFDWIIDVWGRVWKPSKDPNKPHEPRVGANAAPLLATLTLAALWYAVPLARWIGYGPLRFIAVGFVLWTLALIAWLSRCRADRRGPGARFAQQVYRSTGIRRLDQCLLFPVGLVCYLTLREIQLLPLAATSAISFVALLIVEHEFRPQHAAPEPPDLETVDPTPTTSVSGQTEVRTLTWTVTAHGQPRQHRADVTIATETLGAARSSNPGRSDDLGEIVAWVEHGGAEVESLAHQIHDACFKGGYSLFATVSCYVAAAQSVEYVEDLESKGQEEYWRYPIETLADGQGDCEDSAVLLAALLRRAGFRCAIVIAPGHAAVAVEVPHDAVGSYFERDGVRYYYCETTGSGWSVGQVPSGVVIDDAFFIPVPAWEAP